MKLRWRHQANKIPGYAEIRDRDGNGGYGIKSKATSPGVRIRKSPQRRVTHCLILQPTQQLWVLSQHANRQRRCWWY